MLLGVAAASCAWPQRLGALWRCCSQMFNSASAFNQDLANWNTARVFDISRVRSAPISLGDVSSSRAVGAGFDCICALCRGR